MLVLGRRVGEQIWIGPVGEPIDPDKGVTMQVLAISGDKVRLGFTGTDYAMHRLEVLDRILADQCDARKAADGHG